MAKQLLKDVVDTGDLYSVLEKTYEYEEALWMTWTDDRNAFEQTLRQAIQEIEQVKDLRAEYNISIQYQIGKLDGWTEAFERLYRAEESAKKAAGTLSGLSTKTKMILECLYKNKDGMRHGELAAAIGSSDSSLTNIMKRVLLSGTVESVRLGKNTIYYLTDVGRRYCQERDRGERDLKTIIYDCMSSTLEPLSESLQQIADALNVSRRDSDMVTVPRRFTPVLDNNILEPVEVGTRLMIGEMKFVQLNSCVEEETDDMSFAYSRQSA